MISRVDWEVLLLSAVLSLGRI